MTLLIIGTTELLIIAGVALLLFGGKKVPELMKGLGKGMKSYKEGLNGTPDENPTGNNPEKSEILEDEKTSNS